MVWARAVPSRWKHTLTHGDVSLAAFHAWITNSQF